LSSIGLEKNHLITYVDSARYKRTFAVKCSESVVNRLNFSLRGLKASIFFPTNQLGICLKRFLFPTVPINVMGTGVQQE